MVSNVSKSGMLKVKGGFVTLDPLSGRGYDSLDNTIRISTIAAIRKDTSSGFNLHVITPGLTAVWVMNDGLALDEVYIELMSALHRDGLKEGNGSTTDQTVKNLVTELESLELRNSELEAELQTIHKSYEKKVSELEHDVNYEKAQRAETEKAVEELVEEKVESVHKELQDSQESFTAFVGKTKKALQTTMEYIKNSGEYTSKLETGTQELLRVAHTVSQSHRALLEAVPNYEVFDPTDYDYFVQLAKDVQPLADVFKGDVVPLGTDLALLDPDVWTEVFDAMPDTPGQEESVDPNASGLNVSTYESTLKNVTGLDLGELTDLIMGVMP